MCIYNKETDDEDAWAWLEDEVEDDGDATETGEPTIIEVDD
jgi:hypothetical protein